MDTNKEQVYLALIEDLRKQIQDRDELIEYLKPKAEAFDEVNSGSIHAQNFLQATSDAKAILEDLKNTQKEIALAKEKALSAVMNKIKDL